MKATLSTAARTELGLYRSAAALYRGALALRLALPCDPARRRRIAERLGRWDGGGGDARPALWVHAASLGEVLTVAPLLARLRAAHPGYRTVLTCHTETGRAAAADTVADEVRYFPVDTPGAVTRALAYVRPRMFVFVETEIWPSLLLLLAERDVTGVMVNASVSARSFTRYRHVRSLIGTALDTLALVCVRDRASERRLLELGAPATRTHVCGDLKSDAIDLRESATVPDALAAVAAPVLVAASTHAGEDELVLDAFAIVRARHAQARLLLAPRHAERAARVAAVSRERGWQTRLRSADPLDADWDVFILDTAGELIRFFRSAAAVFVGGSLVKVGGHNLFEPASFARPIASGPHLDDVHEQAQALSRHTALEIVDGSAALARVWSACLEDPQRARAAGERARAALEESRGALSRTLTLLAPLLVEGRDEARDS